MTSWFVDIPLQLTTNRRAAWFAYALLIAALATLFFGSLSTHLLDTHDVETFRDNVAISDDFGYLISPDKEHASGRLAYDLVMWAFFLVWGNDPRWFHLLVVGAHVVASLLLAAVARRTGVDAATSALIGLLFLVNVAHFRVIHWISGLNYVLALIGSLATFACYSSAHRRISYPAFYLCLVAAFFSHPATAVILVFCLFWSLTQEADLKRALVWLAPGAVLLIPLVLFSLSRTYRESSAWQAISLYGVPDLASLAWGMAKMLIWLNARLVTTAHWLLVPVAKIQSWEFVVGAGLFAGSILLVRGRRYPVALWAVWMQLFLLPFVVLNEEIILHLPSGPSRYLYLSSAGAAVVMAGFIGGFGRWLNARNLRSATPTVLALSLAILGSSYVFMKRAEAISLYGSARSYAARGEAATSIRLFERAIEQSAETIDLESAYKRLCLMELALGMPIDSLLDKATETYPNNFTFTVFREVLNSVAPDSALRRPSHVKIDSLVADPGSGALASLLVAQTYYNLGRGFYERGYLEQAIHSLDRSLVFNPSALKAVKSLVLAHSAAGNEQLAASRALEAAQANPDDPDAISLTAFSMRSAGRLDEAIALCESALQRNPSFELYYLLGVCYEENHQPERALSAYRRTARARPNNVEVLERIAHLELRQGNDKEAITAFERAADAGANHIQTYLALGRLYADSGNRHQAEVIYRRILQEDFVGSNSAVFTRIGMQLFEWDRVEAAAAMYRRALAMDADNLVARANMGWIFFLQNRVDEAIRAFEIVLEREPLAVANFNLGLAYLARGDLTRAREAYAVAVERFGAAEAVRIGAVDDLKRLIGDGTAVQAGREIIDSYWPEEKRAGGMPGDG